ncbi:MAG: hypothetical protein M1813_005369 [Trichoglossum hirsutum]|nr:MAG: hypothetical protein M1813_005369 [Trichoglossum hirsutum]
MEDASASSRASSLHRFLQDRQMIWYEQGYDGPLMLEEYLNRMDVCYHTLAKKISSIDEVTTFKSTAGWGKVNKREFSAIVGAVFSRLVEGAKELKFNDGGVRYVQSRSNGMQERKHGHPWTVDDLIDRRHNLKPDFFTTRVCKVDNDNDNDNDNDSDNDSEWAPVSLSTVMHGIVPMKQPPVRQSERVAAQAESGGARSPPPVRRSERVAAQAERGGASSPPVRQSERIAAQEERGGASSPPAVITNPSNRFTWDDLITFWEVKSSPDTFNHTTVLSNLILKATETLRFQWQRCFLLVFLVCGTSLRMVRCERSYILVGAPVDFSGDAEVLVKCLIAGFVMDRGEDIGLLMDDRTVEPQDVDGKPRVVVGVNGQNFILGEQIVGPQKDHLAGRATTVHLARKPGDTDWKYCFKCAWPYTVRPHEGVVLNELQGITGVVKMLAWDAPSVPGMWSMTPQRIEQGFLPQQHAASSQPTSSRPTSSRPALSRPVSKEDTVAGNKDVFEFHPRQLRITVTEYIQHSLDTHLNRLGVHELLQVWRNLYLVTDSIARKGYVHRDLSWTNVRLQYSSDTWSPTLIDFDLASPIDGTTSGAPDKTGTAVFMPVGILKGSEGDAVRHQELHEDEVVFWIGFLAILSRTKLGQTLVDELMQPRLSLNQLGWMKLGMVSDYGVRVEWRKWFGTEGSDSREVCNRIKNILFEKDFPPPSEVDEAGTRLHLVMHKQVTGDIVKALGDLITKLEEE